jgi:hypothetical protein
MFSEIHGLPLHPLAVHGAVVFVPLAALMGVLFAVPRTRAWSRIPLVLVSLAALGALWVARQSGLALDQHLGFTDFRGALIAEHKHRANWLIIFMIIFAVIAIAAFVVTRAADPNKLTTNVLAVLLVVGAALVAFQTYRVGDLGSKIVWNPDGKQDFSSVQSLR